MDYLTFNPEKALERLGELEAYISNFPESPLCKSMREEIEAIKKAL